MIKILNNIFTIICINGAILIFPGVNFLLVAKHALLSGFSAGFRCSMGITTAITVHAILSILSVSLLIKTYPLLFNFVRYSGAAFLIYLGTCFLISAFQEKVPGFAKAPVFNISKLRSFQAGFWVDFLNPFVSIFYLTLFSTFITVNGSFIELSIYVLTIFIITLAWFSCVALLFASNRLQNFFQGKESWTQALAGLAMYYFGSRVIFGF